MARSYTLKDYLLNPDADPIRGITALSGKYDTSNFISSVDASVRSTFSLATSVIKGTFKFGTSVAKGLNDRLNQSVNNVKRYESVISTLIGNETTDNMINLFDRAFDEQTALYRNITNTIARNTAAMSDNNMVTPERADTFLSNSLARVKGVASALSKFNFRMPDIIRDALVIDIETGGLGKDAPILQLAMVDMASLERVIEVSGRNLPAAEREAARAAINRMTPEQQMASGFLTMNTMPEAIIRDVSPVDAATGAPRRASYRATTSMPRSMDAFTTQYGQWARGRFQHLDQFYQQFGNAQGEIEDDTLDQINDLLHHQGFIELADGQRIYSQREAAKWSMIYSRAASEQNRMLIAANMPFESFRVGKLWEYFIRNRPRAGQDPTATFDLAAFPSQVNHLNDDADIIQAFGFRDETGALRGVNDLTEFRGSMFAATWRSHYKRNILDPNNYYYQRDLDRLREEGRSSEAIGLFGQWTRNISSGLQTRDQLDLTRMVYSGLMRTGYINESQDIFSGTKIDFATRAFFGEAEEHLGFEDSIHQARILTEAKLFETTSDLFNIHQAREGNGTLLNHIKSLVSATSMLADPMKRGWMTLSRYLKDSDIDMRDADIQLGGQQAPSRAFAGLNGHYNHGMHLNWGRGSVSDIQKHYNVDKEVLRIGETVDFFADVDLANNLFARRTALTNQTVLASTPEGALIPELDANGNLQYDTNQVTGEQSIRYQTVQVDVETQAYEQFNIGSRTGRMRQQKTTQDGRVLHFFRRTHEYGLEDEMREMYTSLTQQAGHTHEAAVERMQFHLFGRLAETESYRSRGITAEFLMERFRNMDADLGGATGRRVALRAKLDTGDRGLIQGIMARSAEQLDRVRNEITNNKYTLRAPNILRGLTMLTPEMSQIDFGLQTMTDPRSPGDFARGAGEVVQNAGRIARETFRALRAAPLDPRALAENFIANSFTRVREDGVGADAALADARWFMNNVGRAAGAVAGIGAVAGAVMGGYLVDDSPWKKTSGEILRMTGKEKEIMPEGHYEQSKISLDSVSKAYTGGVARTNELGTALKEIDQSKVDFAVGDADTIQVLTKGFFGMGRKSIGSVRISGYDAPEVGHAGKGGGPGEMPYSRPGTQYLTNILSAKSDTHVVIGGRQTFGRAVGLVTTDQGTNYSYQMVQQGLGSVLFREKSTEDLVSQKEFMKAEHLSRKTDSGMWSQPYYFGAQAGRSGRERKGWNTLSPMSLNRFGFERSPGTTEEQMEQSYDFAASAAAFGPGGGSQDLFSGNSGESQESYNRKIAMAEMQQSALKGSMQRNRGRGKARR